MKLPAQLNLFLLALGFLTRIPIPLSLNYNARTLNASCRYFTLVGALVGVCMALLYSVLEMALPHSVAVLLMIMANLMLTGCFHQDGLADMADGFGGAFEPARKLEIMKDSRLGTYGSSALIATLALQYVLLLELHAVVLAVIVGQALSRCVAVSLIIDTPYASDPDASKAKPLSQAMSGTDLAVLMFTGVPILLLLPMEQAVSIVAALLIVRYGFKAYIKRQIGGYTGDCLGAAQQLSESAIYLVLLLWQGAAP